MEHPQYSHPHAGFTDSCVGVISVFTYFSVAALDYCVCVFVRGFTDWFDGYLARALNQTSAFGRFLDPVADKLMVAAALVVLVQSQPTIWIVIPAIVIISREIAISALREWMAELGKRANVAVSQIGKWKTTAQMTSITVLLVQHPLLNYLGYVLLYIAVVLTIWSMLIYLKAAWPDLSQSD